MTQPRRLIVNADDFGQSTGINEGIVEAFERGIVTSASLMVRWPAAQQAAGYARSHPDLDVGLHLDLGEWAYRLGGWVPIYEVVQKRDSAAVAAETERQLAAFRTLIGRDPSHIDSHQHVHRDEPVSSILGDAARRLGVPLRQQSTVRYCGDFYGQTAEGDPILDYITLKRLKGLLTELGPGTTELGCHPARQIDFDTMYTTERLQELEVLCDSGIREFLSEHGIRLCSFRMLSELMQ
jgi:predicted glycoside hydrolase/deacetylase ChbG (UPF0249 family)